MNNHRDHNRVVHDENEAVEKPRAAQFRLLTAVAIIVFFAGCSLFPFIAGSYKDKVQYVCPESPVCTSSPVVCSNAEDILILQEHLGTSKANMAYLVQLAGNLQNMVDSYEVPKCSLSDSIEGRIKEIHSRQEVLQEGILALTQQVAEAQKQQALAFNTYSEERSMAQGGNRVVVQTLFTDVASLRSEVEVQKTQASQLEVLATLSRSIAREIRAFDEKVTQSQDISSNYEALTTAVSSISCPRPVIPPVVVPPPVECPSLELPKLASSTPQPAPTVSKSVTPKAPAGPPKDCLLIPDAQRLVAELVTAEVELLTQNLTAYTGRAIEESAHLLSVAAGDASLHALRTFLEESAEESEKLLEEARYHSDMAQAARPAVATTKAAAKAATPAAKTAPTIPELDFALLSAGSRVDTTKTSATYFPSQWRLDRRLQSALDYVGLPLDLQSVGATEGPVKKMYELLSLHKTVGVPEDALEPSTRPGACWPMQGQSGNLTIHMHGAVLIESVSIDHTSTGNRASAPKDFEVYGMSETGRERLIAKGRYQVGATSAAVQNFRVIDDSHRLGDQPFQSVSLRVMTNHGQPEFTCLYRFRVHGIPLP